jgi:hypothetical protein
MIKNKINNDEDKENKILSLKKEDLCDLPIFWSSVMEVCDIRINEKGQISKEDMEFDLNQYFNLKK